MDIYELQGNIAFARVLFVRNGTHDCNWSRLLLVPREPRPMNEDIPAQLRALIATLDDELEVIGTALVSLQHVIVRPFLIDFFE